jgi:hypothetical protein
MPASLLHLHTYFLFPFSINREIVVKEHDEQWKKHQYWMAGLDACVASYQSPEHSPIIRALGPWQRAAYKHSDMDSPAYQDMVFFHPFVRRIFFDTGDAWNQRGQSESLIRCFTIPLGGEKKLWFGAEDLRGRRARVQVTDLRLFLFANGMGILSIGTEAWNISARDALWINETLRKIYPSSGRQLREGRAANRMWFALEADGQETLVTEEKFESGQMVGYQPPLSRLITSLIYFLDYSKQEFEQLLDERMIIYSYAAVDPSSVPENFRESEDYRILISRFLYVDRDGPDYRYEPEFTRGQMREHLYTRWAHEGTYYGFTSYSNISLTLGEWDRGEHVAKEGFLIHRMFDTRYYLMAIIALFYRATLLDFAQKTALVSRRLYHDQEAGEFSRENVLIANALRAEFLHFSNYWYFDELANKDEEIEHFSLQCRSYRVGAMKAEVEQEIEKLNASLHEYYQSRSTEAVNRLAMLSMIFGAGAVLTGFFGMNFEREFGEAFFAGTSKYIWPHYAAIAFVTFIVFGVLAFGVYLVMANPADYRDILTPRKLRPKRPPRFRLSRLRRTG